MRNRIYALVASISLISLAIYGIVFAMSEGVIQATTSPNNQYRAELTRKRFLIERAVYLNAYRGGEKLVHRKLLHTGDFLDDDFVDLYPQYSWASESVLIVGGNVDQTEEQFSSIKVVNESRNQISYLLIETSGNKIILFDVNPSASIELRFPFHGWLSCQGEFVGSGGRFGSRAVAAEGARANQFEIRVSGTGVGIESSEVKLEQGKCCAPDRADFEHELFY